MARVFLSLPAEVVALQGTQTALDAPGFRASVGGPGRGQAQAWIDAQRVSYTLRTQPVSPTEYASLVSYFERVKRSSAWITIKDQVSRSWADLHVGRGDGSTTTFSLPLASASDIEVSVGGAHVDSGDYTLHSAANLINNDGAARADGSYSGELVIEGANNSGADQAGFSFDGHYSVKCLPGGTNSFALRTEFGSGIYAPVTELRDYTVLGVMFEPSASPYQYRMWASFHDSGSSYLSSSTQTPTTATAGVWNVYELAVTTPATTATITPYILAGSAVQTAPWFFGGFAVCPGDLAEWHLPSASPSAIEFDSAPYAGEIIRVTGTGYRFARCGLNEVPRWRFAADGRAQMYPMAVTESLEY